MRHDVRANHRLAVLPHIHPFLVQEQHLKRSAEAHASAIAGGASLTILLGGLAAISPISIDMGLPALPVLEKHFEVALGTGSLTITAYLAGFAAAPLIAGPVSDRVGRRPVLLVGLSLFVLASMACMLSKTFAALLVGRGIQGFFAGVCAVLPLAIVRDLTEGPQAKRLLSHIAAIMGLAPLIAPSIGNVLLFAAGHWQTIFAAQAVTGVLLAVGAAASMPESLPPARRGTGRASFLRSYLVVAAHPRFRSYAGIYATGFASMFAFIAASPAAFIGSFGVSRTGFSALFASGGACFFIGSLASANLSRRNLAGDRLLNGGLWIMVAGGALAVLATTTASIVLFMVPVGLVMFAFGLIGPTATHRAVEPSPGLAGAASGLLRSIQVGTGAIVSGAVGFASEMVGPPLALATAMEVCAVSALLMYLVSPRSRTE